MQNLGIILGLLLIGILIFGCTGMGAADTTIPVETCQANAPFECVPYAYALHNDVLGVVLHNVGPDGLKLTSVSCEKDGGTTPTTASLDKNIAVGDTTPIEFDCKGQTDPNAKIGQDAFSGTLSITYSTASDPSVTKISEFSIGVMYS